MVVGIYWRTIICIIWGALWLSSAPSLVVGQLDVTTANAWSRALQVRFKDLENGALQADQVVAMVNGFIMSHPDRINPDRVWVDQLAKEVSDLMANRVAAARNLAQQAERLYGRDPVAAKVYNSLDPETWDEDFLSSMEYDPHYQRNVSKKFSTLRFPDFSAGGIPTPDQEVWTQGLDSTFRSNLDTDPTLTNQYFGTPTGSMRTFPGGPWVIKEPPNLLAGTSTGSKPQSQMTGFNVKFGYWYVLGASGPKDIVIVIDQSDSMGNLFDVRKAAINVVGGLTSKDFINVVTFSTYAAVASCWQDTLVRATEANKLALMAYLENLEVANGHTNIQAGLDLAAQLLDNSFVSNISSACQQSVILLTDGVSPATAFRLNTIADARVFAYVLNSYTDTSPLQRLTCATDGILVPIPNPGGAYLSVGSYYEVLSPGRSGEDPIWFGPYLDQYTNQGSVMTVVLPCFDRNSFPHRLIGVVGVDLPVADIEVLYSNYMTSPSYAFMVNNEGEALIHPLLPSGATYTSHPALFDIATLENMSNDKLFVHTRSNLVHGRSGEAKFNKTVSQSRGYQLYEGYAKIDVMAHMIYDRIPGSEFSAGIVWATDESLLNNSIHVPVPRENITHITPDTYHITPTTDNSSSFSVAPRGFCNPVRFTDTHEDAEFSQRVVLAVDQPSSASCPSQLLRTDARYDVQSTSHIDVVWNSSLKTYPHVTWRFIATHYTGVLRTLPGRTITEKFDASSAPWYRRGLAHRGNFVASVPYPSASPGDTFSDSLVPSTNVVYFSKLVPYTSSLPPNPPTPSSTITYGVVGMSLTYTELSNTFLAAVPGCTYDRIYVMRGIRCLLLEGTGHMVTHPSFLHSSPSSNKSYIFLGEEEPLLAETLASEGILVPEQTIDYTLGVRSNLITYTISDSGFEHNPDGTSYMTGQLVYSQDCVQSGTYYISKFATTNLFFVVLNITQSGTCAHKSIGTSVTPITEEPCDIVPGERAPGQCPISPISERILNQVRGVQSCNSETHAILMGLLIPGAIGVVVVVFILVAKRRRRSRSMREAGMEAGDHEMQYHPEEMPRIGPVVVVDAPVNPDEVNVDMGGGPARPAPNAGAHGHMRRASSSAVREGQEGGRRNSSNQNPRSRSSNNLRSRNNSGDNNSSGSGRSNTVPNSRSNSRANLSLAAQQPRAAMRSSPAAGPSNQPSPVSSTRTMLYDGYGSYPYAGEGGIPMQMMSQNRAIVHAAYPQGDAVELPISERTDSDISSIAHVQLENDEGASEDTSMYGEGDDGERDEGDDDDEDEEGDEDEDSEVDQDPDDPFAGMAREMGLARSTNPTRP